MLFGEVDIGLGARMPSSCPKREDVTALRCSEPLRFIVGGPSEVFAIFCGLGPPGDSLLRLTVVEL